MEETKKPRRPSTMSQFMEKAALLSRTASSSANGSSSVSRFTARPLPAQESSVSAQLPTPSDLTQAKKGIRGQSKGIPEWNTGVKVHVEFNPITFHPVGDRAGLLKSQLGQIVRNGHRVPLNIMEWTLVDYLVKKGIWEEIVKNVVEVPERYKQVCLLNCNMLWKNHKSKIKSVHFEPHQGDPELGTKCPPGIIPAQWSELVAYWNSEHAKLIAKRNLSIRELRGPCHKTGRKHFAQVRYEMEKTGEELDKFSVWKKTCDLTDPHVQEFIEAYEAKLREKSEEEQNLTSVKDMVFHFVMGDDGHGYCKNFGSGVPRRLAHPKEVSSSLNRNELIKEITKQVHAEFQVQFEQLQARIDCFLNKNITTEHSRQALDATSGDENSRESIEDETPDASSSHQLLAQMSTATSPLQNGSYRVLLAQKAKKMKTN